MERNLVFAQITKVDEAKRLVFGRAVQEVPDRADEIFDYATSKPHFEEWSKGFSVDTDGKSLGNLRAMHGKVAAGKLTGIEFDDTAKAIDIAAKVVDDSEWNKVLEGVYTGFSIGGSYVGDKTTEKIGERTVKRYTAKPAEISLVDSPCIPTARFFEVLKTDGAVAKVAFKPPEYEVQGTQEEVAALAKAMQDGGFTMADVLRLVNADAHVKELNKAEREMLATIVSIETEADLTKREFSADERKAAAKDATALPDGSFPIKTAADLDNAIRAYGRAKDKAAAKAHIIKRAKALGASDKIPAAWTQTEGKKGAFEVPLKKGMYSVQSFASCLETLGTICRSAQFDMGDASPVPAKLRNVLEDAIAVFKEMSAEEADEMLADLKDHAGVGADDEIEQTMAAAANIGALRKKLADPNLPFVEFAKLAAEYLADDLSTLKTGDTVKISDAIIAKAMKGAKVDAAHLQEAHDHLVAAGAACATEKNAAGDLSKVATLETQLAELTAEVKRLNAQPMPYPILLRPVQKTVRNEMHPSEFNDQTSAVQTLLS